MQVNQDPDYPADLDTSHELDDNNPHLVDFIDESLQQKKGFSFEFENLDDSLSKKN